MERAKIIVARNVFFCNSFLYNFIEFILYSIYNCFLTKKNVKMGFFMKTKIVMDYMTRSVITLEPETTIFEAAETFIKNKISGAPVTDKDNKLVGILSEWDCLSIILKGGFEEFPSGNVSDYMSESVVTVSDDTGIFEVTQLFIDKRFHRIPVVKNDKLVGIISRRDLLSAITD